MILTQLQDVAVRLLVAQTDGATGGTMWFPEAASTYAEDVDGLFYFIYWLCVFFFVLIMGATIWWAIKYRRRSGDETQRTSPVKHNFRLEFLWSAIPTVLLVWIFAWSQHDFTKLSAPPTGALDVRVMGQSWNWTFKYPTLNKVCTADAQNRSRFVVPVNRPVKVTLSSADVLHSLWIPAFRVKRDAVPNRYTGYWFEATKTGEYPLFCAEYCGQDHSIMTGRVQVLPEEDFQLWVESSDCAAVSDDDGEGLTKFYGCVACHSADGSKGTGPTFKGVYGRTETLQDGSTITVDDNYIRQSIYDPNSQIVSGFAPQMPTFKGRITEPQLNAIIDYLKTLK